ncbi:hypothetical protein GIB67_027726 [Kingdonia uniflora]|uniref:Pentatricopeptide repeat-containing protein n=1 Tax=Kingdonia uniflora TaxID=39325 RepID=A0A7J7PBY4_9MAGN|nr:hypothetical protein GIB67_027726 [Kingdonia uniflora]
MESKVTHLANLLQSCISKKSHFEAKLLHAQILHNGFFSDTFLSNRLIELYSTCSNVDYSRKIFVQMPQKNVYSWNMVVCACCKWGDVEEAEKLFVRMPERNVISWNTMIGAFVRSGYDEKALGLYDMMILEGFKPTNFTFTSVLSAFGTLLDVESGRRCHGYVIKVGLVGNMYVENALVGMYAKCSSRSIDDAIRAFNELSQPNEVSFTAMMGGLAQTDRVNEAMKMFAKMHRNKIKVDGVAFSSILGVCARRKVVNESVEFGKQVHNLIIKRGFETDLFVSTSLLDMYGKHGNMESAEIVFADLPEISVVSWNVMLAGYGQDGDGGKALETLQRMQSCSFEPDEVTYVSMLGACVKSGDIDTGRTMLDKISHPNVTSFNAILSGYSQRGNHEEALNLFRKMQFSCVRPDRTTVAVILSSCAGMRLSKCGKQVHVVSMKESLHLDTFVASGLVDMYSKCGNLDAAKCIFYKMPERDIVCWNSMIAGFALHSKNFEVLSLFKHMREKGMSLTQFSYGSVLSSCSISACLSQGKQLHAQIVKDGYAGDVYVGSALIDMYSKCGNINGARQFFNNMCDKNIVSWNEMIHGYGHNGCGDEAVVLFENMIKSGGKPDSITFIAVLTACSHSGLVDEGMRILNLMEEEHMVEPLVDHYTCVIDSLGRAARFSEVEILLDRMPCKEDAIIWEVLLSSCMVHTNVDLGKLAAEKLFHLDPHNPAPYVLLFNIYTALGRWDDASAIRSLMYNRGVLLGYGLKQGKSFEPQSLR